jgi:hypothetical protein
VQAEAVCEGQGGAERLEGGEGEGGEVVVSHEPIMRNRMGRSMR